jgi:hypothetical protein
MYNNKTKTIIMGQFKSRFFSLSLLCVAAFAMHSTHAQTNWKASAGAQLTFAELNANDDNINSNMEFGGGLLLGVSYGLNDNWSIHSGIGLSYLRTSNGFSSYQDAMDTTDIENEDFEFRYRLNGYSEEQRSMLLSIPIAVQYESSGVQTRFYSKVGASVNLFLGATSHGKANQLSTSGYFERFNAELTVPRFAGFGTFDDIEFSENDIDIKNSFNAFLEIGVKDKVGSGWMYFGIFAEYGLNNLLENNNSSLIEYNQNTPLDFINNSSLNASNQISGNALFDEVTLNMAGLRIRYEFGL